MNDIQDLFVSALKFIMDSSYYTKEEKEKVSVLFESNDPNPLFSYLHELGVMWKPENRNEAIKINRERYGEDFEKVFKDILL